MRSIRILIILFVSLLVSAPAGAQQFDWDQFDNCTSVLVTKSVSTDGSVMTTHSCDGNYEFRIKVIPGAEFADGAMRPVYKGGGRGRERTPAKIVGEIPQVTQT